MRQSTMDQVVALRKHFDKDILTRSELQAYCEENDAKFPHWLTQAKEYRVGRGQYKLPNVGQAPLKARKTDSKPVTSKPRAKAKEMAKLRNFSVPVCKSYVPWGNSEVIGTILKSGKFFPFYVVGPTGNGKTFSIMQEAAKVGREVVRVNITSLTDEDDLLGGFRLIDGETVWEDGPVVQAMERGALLLLDEIDLGSEKLLCLQPILEGNEVFLKKVSKYVHPAEGFNVAATANTRGMGDETGVYVGTNYMNHAFLERFSITLDQKYAPKSVEKKILTKHALSQNLEPTGDETLKQFITDLTKWIDDLRVAKEAGNSDDVITTRRATKMIEAYGIMGDVDRAVELCLARFDEATRSVFETTWDMMRSDKNDAEVEEEIQSNAGAF